MFVTVSGQDIGMFSLYVLLCCMCLCFACVCVLPVFVFCMCLCFACVCVQFALFATFSGEDTGVVACSCKVHSLSMKFSHCQKH